MGSKNKFAKKSRPTQTIKSKNTNKSNKGHKELTYNIEKILQIKTQKGKKLCLIKWQGYDEEKDITWEPFQNIPKGAIEQYYQFTKQSVDQNKKKTQNKEELQPQSESSHQKVQLKTKQGRLRARKLRQKQEKQQKNQTTKTNLLKKQIKLDKQKTKQRQTESVYKDKTEQQPKQQGKKGLKTSMMGSIPRRPKIIVPSDDSSLSQVGEYSSQNDQQSDKKSSFNKQQSSSNAQGSLFSQGSNSQNKKRNQKLKHLRGNQHVTLQKRLRQRSNQKPKPKTVRKKRKYNEFSDDQEQMQTLGRKPIIIGQTKMKYPTHLQTAQQYPDHQLYSTQRFDPDYEKYVRGYIDHINSSGQFSQGQVSLGDVSDSSHEQGDSYHTERSQRGIPQNTLQRIITKLQDQNKKEVYYKVQTFDHSILLIKEHHIKTYFPRLLVEFQQKVIQDLHQILKQKNQQNKQTNKTQQQKGTSFTGTS